MVGTGYIVALLSAVALATLPMLTVADPWKDESGHGRGADGKGGYKYEEKYKPGGWVKRKWKSSDCKYEYKAGPDSLKEEYKCKGGRHHAGPSIWVPPGHRGPTYPTGVSEVPLDLNVGRCNRKLIGQILGGAAGAAIGSQIGNGRGRIIAIIGGTLAGFFLGGEIGRTMDEIDHLCVDQTLEYAPDGKTIEWHAPGENRHHQVTPGETYQADGGRYCREYTAKSIVGGEIVQTYGTACRQPDGSWQIVS
jgi:surface antigen